MYVKFMNNHQQSHMQFQIVSSNSGDCSGINAESVLLTGGATLNPLAYTAACEAAGLARSINTQPAVRRNSETNPTSQHNRGMYWSQ